MHQLQKLCPRTCGTCGGQAPWRSSAVSQVKLRPLELKNSPGEPTRRPGFNSPYHYRLDWETWIHVTASMEHVMSRRSSSAAGTLLDLPLPSHISTLAGKVLAGDTDAMQLLATPVEELLSAGRTRRNATAEGAEMEEGKENQTAEVASSRLLPPTAIRADFYSYTFSSWDGLWREGLWWDRQLLSRPVIIEPSAGMSPAGPSSMASSPPHSSVLFSTLLLLTPPLLPSPLHSSLLSDSPTAFLSPLAADPNDGSRGKGRGRDVRRSAWQRHWLLLGSVLGVHLAARSVLMEPSAGANGRSGAMREGACMRALRLLNPLASLLAYSAVGLLALTSDYPNTHPAMWLSTMGLAGGYAGVAQLGSAALAMAVAELAMALAGRVGRRQPLLRGEEARGAAGERSCDVVGVSAALLSVLQYVVLPLALGGLAQQAEAWHARLQVR